MTEKRRRPKAAAARNTPADKQVDEFIAKYSPTVAATARVALAKLRTYIPGAVEIVYDNYNALAIGFGPSERASQAIISIALYPRWVNLFFLRGATLSDPNGLLRGSGKVVRHIVLERAEDLDDPAVRELIATALELADVQIDPAAVPRTVVRSISEKQRSRRPGR